MAYLGNDLQVAYSTYRILDNISSSFNGVTTSFALKVGGVAPVPTPINEQQLLISVGGVIQQPDPSGVNGFKLSGGNIVFSSAPATGEAFFGVILAGADYVNVGANFPSGSVSAPSITFDSSLSTGVYLPSSNTLGFATGGTNAVVIDSSQRLGINTTSPIAALHNAGTRTAFNKDGSNMHWFITGDTASEPNAIGYGFESNGTSVQSHRWFTAGSERARVDSLGRLLLGTSTSTNNLRFDAKLAVVSTGSGNLGGVNLTNYGGTSAGTASFIDFNRSRGTTDGSYTSVASGDVLGYLVWRGATGSAWNDFAQITAEVDGTPGNNDAPGRLVFSTTADGASSPTERMRISSTGLVSIKSDSGFANGLKYDNGATSSTQHYDRIYFGAASYYIINNSSVGVRLDSGATSWSAQSDERLKTNLTEISDGLGKVGLLRAVTGRYLNDETTVSRSFLIAQDVRNVLPEAVSEDNDNNGTLNLRYTEVIPLLVAALKESKERIEQLESEMAAVKAQLS